MLDCDVFIYQPVVNHPGYNSSELVKALPSRAKAVSFPYLFFLGYFPDVHKHAAANLATVSKQHPFGAFPYQHLCLDRLAAVGGSFKEVAARVRADDLLDEDYTEQRAEWSLSELKRREATLDVKASAFIEENFKTVRLFETCDHPAPVLLQRTLDQVCDLAGLPRCPLVIEENDLDIIYPGVKRALGLTFPTVKLRYGSPATKTVGFDNYLRAYFDMLYPGAVT